LAAAAQQLEDAEAALQRQLVAVNQAALFDSEQAATAAAEREAALAAAVA